MSGKKQDEEPSMGGRRSSWFEKTRGIFQKGGAAGGNRLVASSSKPFAATTILKKESAPLPVSVAASSSSAQNDSSKAPEIYLSGNNASVTEVWNPDFPLRNNKDLARFTSRLPTTTTTAAAVKQKDAGDVEVASPASTTKQQQQQQQLSSSVVNASERADLLGEDWLEVGISLKHLLSIGWIDPSMKFYELCDRVKEITKDMTGYSSYARKLFLDPETRHVVRAKAELFVSYAWQGNVRDTFGALHDQLEREGKTDIFVWMDVVVVSQNLGPKTVLEFRELAKVFRDRLVGMNLAWIVLTPVLQPFAVGRSWCVFEWATIVDMKVEYRICVSPAEANALKKRLASDVDFFTPITFADLFAKVNVDKSDTSVPSDKEAILELLSEVGLVEVNNIAMKNLKTWLSSIIRTFRDEQPKSASAYFSSSFALASLCYAVGELSEAKVILEELLDIVTKTPSGDDAIRCARVMGTLGDVYAKLGERDDDSTRLLEDALEVFARHFEENLDDRQSFDMVPHFLTLVKTRIVQGRLQDASAALDRLNWLPGKHNGMLALSRGSVLEAEGNYDEARRAYLGAMLDLVESLGPEHPDTARVMCEVAEYFARNSKMEEAFTYSERAMLIAEKVFGKNHLDYASVEIQFATSRFHLEMAEGSIEVRIALYNDTMNRLHHARDVRIGYLGEEHPQVARAFVQIGIICASAIQLKRAKEAFARAISIMSQESFASGIAQVHEKVKLQTSIVEFYLSLSANLSGVGQESEATVFRDQAMELLREHILPYTGKSFRDQPYEHAKANYFLALLQSKSEDILGSYESLLKFMRGFYVFARLAEVNGYGDKDEKLDESFQEGDDQLLIRLNQVDHLAPFADLSSALRNPMRPPTLRMLARFQHYKFCGEDKESAIYPETTALYLGRFYKDYPDDDDGENVTKAELRAISILYEYNDFLSEPVLELVASVTMMLTIFSSHLGKWRDAERWLVERVTIREVLYGAFNEAVLEGDLASLQNFYAEREAHEKAEYIRKRIEAGMLAYQRFEAANLESLG